MQLFSNNIMPKCCCQHVSGGKGEFQALHCPFCTSFLLIGSTVTSSHLDGDSGQDKLHFKVPLGTGTMNEIRRSPVSCIGEK